MKHLLRRWFTKLTSTDSWLDMFLQICVLQNSSTFLHSWFGLSICQCCNIRLLCVWMNEITLSQKERKIESDIIMQLFNCFLESLLFNNLISRFSCQVAVVNPAMDRALKILQKFVIDVQSGHISKDKLCFGAPWRHPPRTSCPDSSLKWAKLQLMDFLQSLVNAEFGVRICCAQHV